MRGGRNHGLLGLVVTPAEYAADVNPANPFVHPVNPGLGPVFPANTTQHQIAQLNHQYSNAKDEYILVNTVKKALGKQITDSIEDVSQFNAQPSYWICQRPCYHVNKFIHQLCKD
jgi:hypothetical protein